MKCWKRLAARMTAPTRRPRQRSLPRRGRCVRDSPSTKGGERPMRCPFCGFDDTQVKDSRPTEDNGAIRRRRFCTNCGQRFTTIERVQLRELTVVKNDGRRVPFDRDKLARSIRVSMRKRPIQEERIERIVNSVVRQLEASGDSDIPSKQIGELVMDTLKELDKVAYVRFASVYRNFREAKDFEDFVGGLSSVAEE